MVRGLEDIQKGPVEGAHAILLETPEYLAVGISRRNSFQHLKSEVKVWNPSTFISSIIPRSS